MTNTSNAGASGGSVPARARVVAGHLRAVFRFTSNETSCLVRLMGLFQPICLDKRDFLVNRFNARISSRRRRDEQGLWKKFKLLYKEHPPTSDPRCPRVICTAKIVQRAIYIKSDMDNGDVDGSSGGSGPEDFPPPEDYLPGSMRNMDMPDLGLGPHSEDEGAEGHHADYSSSSGDSNGDSSASDADDVPPIPPPPQVSASTGSLPARNGAISASLSSNGRTSSEAAPSNGRTSSETALLNGRTSSETGTSNRMPPRGSASSVLPHFLNGRFRSQRKRGPKPKRTRTLGDGDGDDPTPFQLLQYQQEERGQVFQEQQARRDKELFYREAAAAEQVRRNEERFALQQHHHHLMMGMMMRMTGMPSMPVMPPMPLGGATSLAASPMPFRGVPPGSLPLGGATSSAASPMPFRGVPPGSLPLGGLPLGGFPLGGSNNGPAHGVARRASPRVDVADEDNHIVNPPPPEGAKDDAAYE